MFPLLKKRRTVRGEDGTLLGFAKPLLHKNGVLGYEVRRGGEKFFVHTGDIIHLEGNIIIKPDCLSRADEVIEKLQSMERFSHPRILTRELLNLEREASFVLHELKDLIRDAEYLIKRGKADNVSAVKRIIAEVKARIRKIENSKIYRRIREMKGKTVEVPERYGGTLLLKEVEKISESERQKRLRKIFKEMDEILFER